MTPVFPGPAYRIQTPRLVIRCWNPADVDMLKAAIEVNIDHLRPWLSFARIEPEDLQAKIERMRQWRARFDRDEDYTYGIFEPQETRVVGGTGLHKRVGERAFEIGYWIDGRMINQGLATEVSAALVKVAFEILDAVRVEIHCDPRNLRSAAVPRKLGFIHEATLRERLPDANGEWQDLMIWSTFRSDYASSPCRDLAIQAYDVVGRQIL